MSNIWAPALHLPIPYFSIYLHITHLKFPSASFPLHSSLTLSCLISCWAAQLCPALCDIMDMAYLRLLQSIESRGCSQPRDSNPRLHLLRCRWIHKYHSATRAASLRSYSCQINFKLFCVMISLTHSFLFFRNNDYKLSHSTVCRVINYRQKLYFGCILFYKGRKTHSPQKDEGHYHFSFYQMANHELKLNYLFQKSIRG